MLQLIVGCLCLRCLYTKTTVKTKTHYFLVAEVLKRNNVHSFPDVISSSKVNHTAPGHLIRSFHIAKIHDGTFCITISACNHSDDFLQRTSSSTTGPKKKKNVTLITLIKLSLMKTEMRKKTSSFCPDSDANWSWSHLTWGWRWLMT